MKKILVDDKVKWSGDTSKVYTVIEIEKINNGKNEMYLVTHPSMLFPKAGMWIYENEIIRLVQERDVK